MCNNLNNLENFFGDLNSEFKIKIYTLTKKFVNIELHRCKETGIILNQITFIDQIINQYGMKDAKPALTPVETAKVDVSHPLDNKFPYRKLLGSLVYLYNVT